MPKGTPASLPEQLSAGALGVVILVWMFGSCLCGHFDAYGLLGTVPGAILAWTGLVKNQSPHLITRCGLGFVAITTTFLLLKVITDVMWTGHEPMFTQPPWIERWIYWREITGF
ncbi:MAG TPA: hypothetical protein VGH19_04665 [Verrucomicrobiae bacterium]